LSSPPELATAVKVAPNWGCSAAELYIAMTILMLLSNRINDLLTLIALLPNAASIRFRFYFGKSTLLLLFILLLTFSFLS
jgi:hypothetical protein